MDFCYLTISGGYFISQLAILIKLYKARSTFLTNHHFDAIFSASGGNIAAYLSLLFNNNETSIERKLDKINYTLFVNEWSKGRIKVGLINLFQSTLYTDGVGMRDFITRNFENLNSQHLPEIWSLCYNQDVDCGGLFCSKSFDNSLFKQTVDADLIKSGVGIINYLDGDSKLISDICIASAAIPGVVKPVSINDTLYIDGGVLNATSGSYFTDVQFDCSYFHYYYVLPCRIYDIDIKQKFNKKKEETHWTSSMFNAVKNITSSQIINDKNFMFENWKRRTGLTKAQITSSTYHDISDADLSHLLKTLNTKHFFMVVYTDMCNVDISRFTSSELKHEFNKAIRSVNIEIYFEY